MTGARFVIAALMLSATAPPQVSPATGQIEGVILSASTGKPLPGARVVLAGKPVTAGADGRFRVDGIQTRFARLVFEADAHLPRELTYSLEPERHLRDVTVQLSRGAAIRGRILNSRGQPVVEALVTAFSFQTTPSGGTELMAYDSRAMTDDRGDFRLAGLDSGRYLLSISPSSLGFQELPAPASSEPLNRGKGPLLYPGVAEAAQAKWIDVREGETVELPAVALPGNRFGTIQVRMTNPTGVSIDAQPSITRLFVNGWMGGVGSSSVSIKPGETSEARYWPYSPGILLVTVGGRDEKGSFSVQSVARFSGADVTVPITLMRSEGSAGLRVIMEASGQVTPLRQIDVLVDAESLTAATPRPALTMLEGPVIALNNLFSGADGRIALANLPKEPLQLLGVRQLPAGAYVASIRQGERNVLRDGFLADADEVEIRVRPDGGILRGSVTDSDRRPLHDAIVVLLPAGPLAQSRFVNLRSTTRTAQDGSFEMRGIAPGVYNVYAWSALEYPSQAGNPRHLDPAFLGSFERRRQEISVVEKENRTLTLTLD